MQEDSTPDAKPKVDLNGDYVGKSGKSELSIFFKMPGNMSFIVKNYLEHYFINNPHRIEIIENIICSAVSCTVFLINPLMHVHVDVAKKKKGHSVSTIPSRSPMYIDLRYIVWL